MGIKYKQRLKVIFRTTVREFHLPGNGIYFERSLKKIYYTLFFIKYDRGGVCYSVVE